MAVIWAGRCLNPCFDWTSVRRRSLAGTEVMTVPESRPASLDNYCFLTKKSWFENLEKASIRSSLRNSPHSLDSLYLSSGRGKCHGHTLAVLPHCSSMASPFRNSAVPFVIPGAADCGSRR